MIQHGAFMYKRPAVRSLSSVMDVLADTVVLSAMPGFEGRPTRGAGTSILLVSVLASC